jgi:glycerophosphoryl diester phosphodiesterase
VRDTPFLALKQFDAGAWFKGHSTLEQIPHLDEVLKLPFNQTGLLIEIKEDPLHVLSRQVMQTLSLYPHLNTIVGSFSLDTVRYIQHHYPHQPLAGIAETALAASTFQKHGIQHLILDHTLLTQKTSLQLSLDKVWAFTVDDKTRAQQLIKQGIGGIITNNPRLMR